MMVDWIVLQGNVIKVYFYTSVSQPSGMGTTVEIYLVRLIRILDTHCPGKLCNATKNDRSLSLVGRSPVCAFCMLISSPDCPESLASQTEVTGDDTSLVISISISNRGAMQSGIAGDKHYKMLYYAIQYSIISSKRNKKKTPQDNIVKSKILLPGLIHCCVFVLGIHSTFFLLPTGSQYQALE